MTNDDTGAGGALCYVVTDIETDGPTPGRQSMRSFASVVVGPDGEIGPQFEACLATLDGAEPDPTALAWLQGDPAVWADATRDPQPPAYVMVSYVDWIRALPAPALFVAHPLAFDGLWIDWCLRRFTGHRLAHGPLPGEPLFHGTGLDLPSLVMGVMGWNFDRCNRAHYPPDWLGGHAHTHRAIDDAMGYAHLLKEMLRRQITR